MASAAIGPWLDSQPSNSGPVACSRWYASSSVPVALDSIAASRRLQILPGAGPVSRSGAAQACADDLARPDADDRPQPAAARAKPPPQRPRLAAHHDVAQPPLREHAVDHHGQLQVGIVSGSLVDNPLTHPSQASATTPHRSEERVKAGKASRDVSSQAALDAPREPTTERPAWGRWKKKRSIPDKRATAAAGVASANAPIRRFSCTAGRYCGAHRSVTERAFRVRGIARVRPGPAGARPPGNGGGDRVG